MTLSEIADWHDAVKNEWPGTVEGVFHAHAAATLREIEARETRALAVAEHHADESMVLQAKLKIATEALDDIRVIHGYPDPTYGLACKALARIKEV